MTEKLTLGKQSSLLGGKTVGEFPCGIPVNIQITGEWCEKIVSIYLSIEIVFLSYCITFHFVDYMPRFVTAFDFFCC